jgi:site-specific DNA recombinase
VTEGKVAAVYTRVSTDEQAEHGHSIDEQERRCRDFIVREEGWTYAETFAEAGVKGTLASRPQLDRLLVRLDDFDVVVINSLDRLGRSTKNLLELYDLFEAKGVALVFLRERVDTSTPVGRLLRTVLSAIAEFERDLIAERTSSALAARARKGRVAAGTPKYGYRWGDEKDLVVVPDQARVVRAIFKDLISGMSQREIGRKLNAESVPTWGGGTWTQSAISKILRSPVYTGKVEYKGEVFDGDHEAIIDDETWEKAKALRSGPRRKGGRTPDRGHLLGKGLLRCTCGSAMIPTKARDVYECKGRIEHGTAYCTQGSIKRVEIDEPFVGQVLDAHVDLEATQKRIADRAASALELAREAEGKRDRKVAKIEAALAQTERDYDEDVIDGRQYAKRETRLTAELADLTKERDETRTHVQRLEQAIPVGDAETVLLERLAALKKAITAGVGSAPDMSALRNVIGDLFEQVRLVRGDDFSPLRDYQGDGVVDLTDDEGNVRLAAAGEGLYIVPVIRGSAWAFEDFKPVPVELPFTDHINKVTGYILSDMFPPIPVGA